MIINGTYYFYHYDPIGNVLFVTDASGNRNTSYVQEGFGNVLAQSGSADNNYHLTTKEIDSDTGLYYFYARWYDAGVGRFVSADPIWHVNLYSYVENNPVSMIDPDGRFAFLPIIKIGIGVVGIIDTIGRGMECKAALEACGAAKKACDAPKYGHGRGIDRTCAEMRKLCCEAAQKCVGFAVTIPGTTFTGPVVTPGL